MCSNMYGTARYLIDGRAGAYTSSSTTAEGASVEGASVTVSSPAVADGAGVDEESLSMLMPRSDSCGAADGSSMGVSVGAEVQFIQTAVVSGGGEWRENERRFASEAMELRWPGRAKPNDSSCSSRPFSVADARHPRRNYQARNRGPKLRYSA